MKTSLPICSSIYCILPIKLKIHIYGARNGVSIKRVHCGGPMLGVLPFLEDPQKGFTWIILITFFSEKLCKDIVACRASHFIEVPCQTSFCPVFLFFLLVCFRRLTRLLPPLCVILVFAMCIRVLLLYVSKITHTHIFLLGLANVYFVFSW